MSVIKKTLLILIAAILCIAGCKGKSQQAQPDKAAKVLAKVNGTPITTQDLNYRPQRDHGGADTRTRSLDDIINQELIYQQGMKLKLDDDPSYRQFIEKNKNQIPAVKRMEMGRRLFNTQIAPKADITLKDGKEYYDRNAERISTALHLLLIKVDERQKADEALKKIRAGASFETVAKPLTGDTPKGNRKPWDQGFLRWDQIPVDFVEAIYALKPGEVSDVLGSQQTGFQIAKLVERKSIPLEDYASMQAVVINRLRDIKMLEAFNKYVAELRKNAKIEKY